MPTLLQNRPQSPHQPASTVTDTHTRMTMKWQHLMATKLAFSPLTGNLPRNQGIRAVHRQSREKLEKGSGQLVMRSMHLQRLSDHHLQTGARQATRTPSQAALRTRIADGSLARSRLAVLHGQARTSICLLRTKSDIPQSLDRKTSELLPDIQFEDRLRTSHIRGTGSLSEYDSMHFHARQNFCIRQFPAKPLIHLISLLPERMRMLRCTYHQIDSGYYRLAMHLWVRLFQHFWIL